MPVSRVLARVDPNHAKRQKRQELKRAAAWESATGVITGGQAALDKAVSHVILSMDRYGFLRPRILPLLSPKQS